jgi:hypothetical protein
MRTTVNLDEDVLAVVRERARRERRSVGEVLSDLARQALTGREAISSGDGDLHGFRPLPHRGRLVSNDLIDQLREDEPE